MSFSPLIEALIEALRCLPGVGRKSAQRMALQLLERDRQGASNLAQSLLAAVEGVGRCQRCRNHSETDICATCSSPRRDGQKLCIVETPADVLAVDQSTDYSGLYFVLMGHLSPLDGIGPEALGLPELFKRLQSETMEQRVQEVIIATNPTVEGEATAHFIYEHIKSLPNCEHISVTRIAHGVPIGGELEYVDGGTLAHAFAGRKAW
ncbi:MAG: recombination mediator RecR [Gammaproteobacteria bacterium]|jgi:recombination protein RecR|nr:recombination mediator RecR [Gammaproteobacteria bacterium]